MFSTISLHGCGASGAYALGPEEEERYVASVKESIEEMKSIKNRDSTGLAYVSNWVTKRMIECAGRKDGFVLHIK